MKKIYLTAGAFFLLLSLCLSFQPISLASEKGKLKIFGVGSTVKSIQDDEYVIATKGEKAEEGFVYTPPGEFSGKAITYQITLKGKGAVRMKVEETDPRGQFIKEKSLKINLTEQWKTYQLPYTLNDITSQIDVMVLTSKKNKTNFHFKALQIR